MSSSESKMATGVVKKMLLTMGIPMIFSMMLQALYNICDSAFVSNMGKNGELALNCFNPCVSGTNVNGCSGNRNRCRSKCTYC